MSLVADFRVRRGAFTLNAHFDMPAQAVTALFGPSGAGKSLLLSALAGLTRLDAGQITLNERQLDHVASQVRAPPHLRGIGLVFQDARLLPHLTVRGNLAYAADRAPVDRRPLTLEEVAAYFEVSALLDRPVRNLSGGERSRVALARAVLSAPDMLLLDEPFAALDGARRRAFLEVLRAMHQRFALPMLVVTHQIDDAAALADHVIGLRAGEVVAAGALAATTAGAAFQGLLDAGDVGSAVRLESANSRGERAAWVRADNVLLANAPPSGLSARHVWQARISAMVEENARSVLVGLDASGCGLYARITPAAVAELNLTQGATVWAIVKEHAL